jgi:hypothetical protein
LNVGTWHVKDWWGAALPASDIARQTIPEQQATLVRRFIDGAVERLLDYN